MALRSMAVIGTSGLHEWGGGLSSQLSVQFFCSEHSFSQIDSISEIVYINQDGIKSVWKGVFEIFQNLHFSIV